MGKAIMLSVRPNWTARILNGEKTIEVRKKFPKDYVGWVYIYCTKNGGYLTKTADFVDFTRFDVFDEDFGCINKNGKVVARFWCDKVEEIRFDLENTYFDNCYYMSSMNEPTLCKKSCLTKEQLNNYLGTKGGYAIHITKLEIFDRPRELNEFDLDDCRTCHSWGSTMDDCHYCMITRPPQNYCYCYPGDEE